jgi:hypothetical protein
MREWTSDVRTLFDIVHKCDGLMAGIPTLSLSFDTTLLVW